MTVGEYKAFLDISESPHSEPVWAGFCKFNNIGEALNEILDTDYTLCNKGFADTEVTGMDPVYTFTGKRYRGDKLQDWLFDPKRKYATGDMRRSIFKIEAPTEKGTTQSFEVPCTICNLMEISGETTERSAVSVEIHFDEEPTFKEA